MLKIPKHAIPFVVDEAEMKDGAGMSGIEKIRKKIEEWGYLPYHYQIFNKTETPDWRNPLISADILLQSAKFFDDRLEEYKSFQFSIEPVMLGEVKPCSYSMLQQITDFKPASLIQKTLSGRLFHGTIREGSQKRPAIVKTWDFLLPEGLDYPQRASKFPDEIELFADDKANKHPNLAKLYGYCCETRLAAVYDENFTRVLSDVLSDDDFRWDKRLSVANQLANLLAWLHGKSIAVGSVTASCIMIDEEMAIKVFDFGFVSHHANEDTKFSIVASAGREAPEVVAGAKRTMKSDVYIFGLLLLVLISKEEFSYHGSWYTRRRALEMKAKSGKKYLVNECFTEVGSQTALEITLLTLRCMSGYPAKRPAMKDVSDALTALRKGVREGKRKRDENELLQELCEWS